MKIDIILNESSSPKEYTELGKIAESYGARAIWSSSYVSERDPFMSLVPLVMDSSKILLGPLAISPFELHPLKMANALFTLNEMSGGRATIVVGGGGGLLRGMKLPYERRVTAVRECMEILKEAHPDKLMNYEGELYNIFRYKPAYATSKPPLIYVGASGPQMMRMATRLADGLMMSDVPITRMGEIMEWINSGLKENGRSLDNFAINNFWAWHVKKDKEESRREARRELVWRGMLEMWWLEPFMGPDECKLVRDNFESFRTAFYRKSHIIEGVPDEIVDTLVDNLCFAGDYDDLDEIIDKLKQFEAAGLTEIALRVHEDQAAAIKLIGERVIPAVS